VTSYYEGMEMDFLKRINDIVGEHQMNKIKGMIQDIVNSREVNQNFEKFLTRMSQRFPVPDDATLDISLLTKAKWPAEVLELDVCKAPGDLK